MEIENGQREREYSSWILAAHYTETLTEQILFFSFFEQFQWKSTIYKAKGNVCKSSDTQQIVGMKTNQIRRMDCFAYRPKNEQEIRECAPSASLRQEKIEEEKNGEKQTKQKHETIM